MRQRHRSVHPAMPAQECASVANIRFAQRRGIKGEFSKWPANRSYLLVIGRLGFRAVDRARIAESFT
jgi:hypothetical protein